MDLTLATLNIWGLPAPMSWPPRRVRFPRIRRWLDDNAFDVVALQELWRTPFRPPHLDHLVVPAGTEANSGLALATRFPATCRHTPYGLGAPFFEALWTAKGFQRATLDVGGVTVEVFNTHLQAYRRPKWVALRSRQIDALLDEAAAVAGPVVLAGDFNVYSAISSDAAAVARIETAGFVDAVRPFDPRPTFDLFGEHERFDRVFVRGLAPVAARVDAEARLADHRPVVVTMRV